MEYTDFIFNGSSLSSKGLMALDSFEETTQIGLNRELNTSNLSPYRNTIDTFSTQYSEPLTLTFLIMKDVCVQENIEDPIMTNEDLESIMGWLSSPKTPRTLTLVGKNDCEYYGYFTEFEPLSSGALNGIIVRFKCNAPYGFRKVTKSIAVEAPEEGEAEPVDATIKIASQEREEYLYPVITVTSPAEGEYSLKNETDNIEFTFTLSEEYSELIINCDKQYIMGDGNVLTFSDLGWTEDDIIDWNGTSTEVYKINWFRIMPNINNDIEISGVGNYSMLFRVPVKNGGY